jgi:hypothetical protein
VQYCVKSGPGSVVGIATGYGLDGPGSNLGGGEIFRTCPDRLWSPTSLLYNGYRVKKAWKELYFIMQTLKMGNSSTKSLAYMSLVRPILEYGTRVLGSVQGGTNKCSRQGAKKESGLICISNEQSKLGNFGVT